MEKLLTALKSPVTAFRSKAVAALALALEALPQDHYEIVSGPLYSSIHDGMNAISKKVKLPPSVLDDFLDAASVDHQAIVGSCVSKPTLPLGHSASKSSCWT